MKSLTVWQPWASLIVGSPTCPPQKPVENRSWPPPASLIGERIAIHAGKTLDLAAFHKVFAARSLGKITPPYVTPGDFPRGAIVGVATLDKVFKGGWDAETIAEHASALSYSNGEPLGIAAARFFFGPVGWVFRDRRHIAAPVECRGAQGLWTLTPEVDRAVVAQIGATP